MLIKKSDLPQVIIYTDGACTGNPGPGGYGVILKSSRHRKEISAGYRLTTNNRMELMAVIAGLEAVTKRCQIILHTDSQYIADSINKGWVYQWREKGWRRGKREKAQNVDLWEKILPLLDDHEVEVKWVRGHAGDPENERADFLAVQASRDPELLADEYYEKMTSRNLTFL
jgi:ribonuclease HI